MFDKIVLDYIIRKATLHDREAIDRLIAAAARGISTADYSRQQIEAAITTVFNVDTDLILDGTYFVAERDGMLIGCGGWSKRKTLFGGDRYAVRDSSEIDPQSGAAKIRAFFVHPDYARKGIGQAILVACENEARAYGFRSLELMATLPGLSLYTACGYERDDGVRYDIGDGMEMEFVPMRKDLQ